MHRATIGTATLYCGDCRDILPGIQADAMITDPVWPNCPSGLLAGSEDPFGLLAETFRALRHRPQRSVIVLRHDSDPRFLQAVPHDYPFFRTQILPYVMPGYIGRKLGGDELAYCFGEPIPSAPRQRVIPGYAPKVQPGGRQANGHPCPRAIDHFRFLVGWWSTDGETVLDPFMGSGTTLVAAIEQGRRAVGIEIDPRYYEIACRRADDAQRQTRMEV